MTQNFKLKAMRDGTWFHLFYKLAVPSSVNNFTLTKGGLALSMLSFCTILSSSSYFSVL